MDLSTTKQKFLDNLRSLKRSTNTIIAYGKDIEQLLEFLTGERNRQKIEEATKEDLTVFLKKFESAGFTPKTLSRKLNSVRTFFGFLKNEGLITDSPALSVSHPKFETAPPRILSQLEYRALRDACRADIRILAIVELMLQTGVKIGEVSRLKVEDVKFTQGTIPGQIYIASYEGNSERTVPLNRAAEQALADYLEIRPKTREKSLFITKTGRPLLIRNIRAAIQRYFRIAGIREAKVNDLRHTWVAHHLMSGASLVLVSKLAGHKRLSTTEKYLDLVKEQIESKEKLGEL